MADDKHDQGNQSSSQSGSSSGPKGPDNKSSQELQSQEQYAYLDQSRGIPAGSALGGPSAGDLNPAFYPKAAKSEAMHSEAEKAGADFPGQDMDAEDMSRKGEDLPGVKEQQAAIEEGQKLKG